MTQLIKTKLSRDSNGNKCLSASFGIAQRIRNSYDLSLSELDNHKVTALKLIKKLGFTTKQYLIARLNDQEIAFIKLDGRNEYLIID